MVVSNIIKKVKRGLSFGLKRLLSKRKRRRLERFLGRYGPIKNPKDAKLVIDFLFDFKSTFPLRSRMNVFQRIQNISDMVRCFHTQGEMATVAKEVLRWNPLVEGAVVECGSYKGGSTAKISVVAKLSGRKLHVFDSFSGLPENDEQHDRSIFGEKIRFRGGQFRATINEVKSNVSLHGEFSACQFYPGWFADTLKHCPTKVVVAYIDVDLVSSTRDCIRAIYPRLVPGGVIISQDGHIPLIVDLLSSRSLWAEIGETPPHFSGLGTKKLVTIRKPEQTNGGCWMSIGALA